MAKKIRFPLQMNGTDVRTIEELRENFDLSSVLGYLTNGKLVTWLEDRYYDNEAMAVRALSTDETDLNQKLMSILGVSDDVKTEEIDLEEIQRRNEKLMLLRQITDDEEIINNVDCVAFNQDELYDILDDGKETIYLCQGEFNIPLTVKNVMYIGLDDPIVFLRAYDNVNFASLNINFVNICFGWDISSITNKDRLYQAERLMEQLKFENAINILETLIAEKNPRAFTLLGLIYGKVYINKEKERELNNKGAELGNVFDFISVDKEFSKYKELLHKMVNKGDKIAMGYLGYIYFIENDFDNAFKFTKLGASKKDMLSCEALYYLHMDDFFCGKVPKKYVDKRKALIYGKQAAALGHADIANRMGVIYAEGEIVPKDMTEAIKYYEIAVSYGNTFACNNLASCYRDGNGVEQNYEKAVELYKKAAEQGYAGAQNELGVLLFRGDGVEQDYNLALHWFELAASNGNEVAKENVDETRRKINESSRILSDSDLEELKKNDEAMKKNMQKIGRELNDEISSITDEIRTDGFFDIF